MSENINTEGPAPKSGAAAGGSDPAKEAAIAAQGEVKDGEVSGTPAGNREPHTFRENAEETVTTSGEEATPVATAANQGGDDEETREPTPEEQAELDAMVDYTIKEGDFEKMPDDVREKALANGVKVGDTIKVAKDHPFLADDADTSNEDDQS